MQDHITDYGNGILAIDSGYGRPRLDAVHLLIEDGHAALIDTAHNAGIPRILAALASRGLKPEQVDYLILTHIHLDHAGAAGQLMQLLPHAQLLVHPLGAYHITEPAKLVKGATAVYGPVRMQELYGDIPNIDSSRVTSVQHEAVIDFRGRELLMLHTPGHARHHICIRDSRTGHFFTGDTFGLSYRECDHDGRQFICPTTTPVHFDPDALHRSVELLMSYQPPAMYLTHYSQVRDTPRLAADLLRLVDAAAAAALSLKNAGAERHQRLLQAFENIMLAEAERANWGLQGEALRQLLAMDSELNAQGLGVWLDSQR